MKKKDLSAKDYQKIVIDWNKGKNDYPQDKTIHQLFEEQVKKTPNNIAVVFADQQLTYNQLNEEANQLARYIHKQNPGEFVAICMDRSLEMIVAILGILKAGCAYVPIDPNYPQERIDYILADIQAKLVLDNSLKATSYYREAKENLISMNGPDDLAYVIYTSGTTGKPKGVMVEHKDFLFYQHSFNALLSQSQSIISAFTLSYCFDASLPTLFSSLITGGKVVVTKELLDISSIDYFNQLRKHHVNVIRFTPSLLRGVIDELLDYKQPLTIVLGGEAYDERLIARIIKHSTIILYNQYGPTEAVVGSTIKRLTATSKEQVIGKQYPGKLVYVLDNVLSPVPIGVIGELYIGGSGLARGYLNQLELTKECFIVNPFGAGRLYKTGDLVRWLPDGNLEYIGRNDFQVKIRGYRIELGEIEHVLSAHPDIRQSVVLAHDAKLIAYYVGQTNEPLDDYLRSKLPDYMIPSAFIAIE
ncbi:MAG: amino acid adenylation domain-containing protein, partial [Legionellaceae bacterium]|nr:amino acid adenylation domain-containing protein [Legionellaceae bacterium]